MQINELIYIIAALVLAGLIAFTTTPAVSVLAYKIGAIDVPADERRMHKKPTPRIGGLAIFAGFVVATLVFCDITPELIAIYIGGLIIVAVGVIDDVFRINAWIKLAAQVGVALIAVSQGVVIEFINFFGTYITFGAWSIPITVMWIVGLTNAINLIDGLDGLACGVSAICSLSLLTVMILKGEYFVALLTAVIVGSCLGFLPFNSNPAKIFMGDTGALFLGYTMAVISVSGIFKIHTVISFVIPLSIFGLPLCDTAFAFLRRILHGKSPFSADRGHLHHRLIDMGFNQKQSVRILYAICGILGTSAIMFTQEHFVRAIIIIVAGFAIFLINFLIMRRSDEREKMGLEFSEKEEEHLPAAESDTAELKPADIKVAELKDEKA
ncbi:MAG: undecaprenyl/decaprenyl-phosphate alpha-N-acetylglucosaminyl 1-phosphate transferase [Clostridiales bacterium]|nr:undecaprenyl/decaprenyl-phosphate alpha-N-acetylglucosaminyl 1-phosphate transferase [Clostridiales bacterium]